MYGMTHGYFNYCNAVTLFFLANVYLEVLFKVWKFKEM